MTLKSFQCGSNLFLPVNAIHQHLVCFEFIPKPGLCRSELESGNKLNPPRSVGIQRWSGTIRRGFEGIYIYQQILIFFSYLVLCCNINQEINKKLVDFVTFFGNPCLASCPGLLTSSLTDTLNVSRHCCWGGKTPPNICLAPLYVCSAVNKKWIFKEHGNSLNRNYSAARVVSTTHYWLLVLSLRLIQLIQAWWHLLSAPNVIKKRKKYDFQSPK